MAEKVKVPNLGESITEATIGSWLKSEGDSVEEDEAIAELETDKVAMEVNSPVKGVLKKILVKEGEDVSVGDPIAEVEEGESAGESEDTEEKSEEKEDDRKKEESEAKEDKEKEDEEKEDTEDKEDKKDDKEDQILSSAAKNWRRKRAWMSPPSKGQARMAGSPRRT